MTIVRRMVVPAKHEELARLAAFANDVARETGFDPKTAHRVELAVDEACTNIIEHAYGRGDGAIGIEASLDFGIGLKIVLTDTGRTFDPETVPVPNRGSPLDETPIGGLGLYLMRAAMDTVQFEFNVPNVGNRLIMTKAVAPATLSAHTDNERIPRSE